MLCMCGRTALKSRLSPWRLYQSRASTDHCPVPRGVARLCFGRISPAASIGVRIGSPVEASNGDIPRVLLFVEFHAASMPDKCLCQCLYWSSVKHRMAVFTNLHMRSHGAFLVGWCANVEVAFVLCNRHSSVITRPMSSAAVEYPCWHRPLLRPDYRWC